jgi:hypothetical protein
MKLKKKTSITNLFTERFMQICGALLLIAITILCGSLLFFVTMIIDSASSRVKYILLICILVAIFVMIVVSISIEIKRKIVGLVRSSKLLLSEQEMLELGINSFTEYLSFLDKYLGKNTLYISQEQYDFLNELCIKEKGKPLFLIISIFIDDDLREYVCRSNPCRFTIYNFEEVSKDISSYALLIKNAKISYKMSCHRCLQVIGEEEDYFRDNLQILSVVNRQDYLLYDDRDIRRIVKSEEIK